MTTQEKSSVPQDGVVATYHEPKVTKVISSKGKGKVITRNHVGASGDSKPVKIAALSNMYVGVFVCKSVLFPIL
jgi:hypothetical protein